MVISAVYCCSEWYPACGAKLLLFLGILVGCLQQQMQAISFKEWQLQSIIYEDATRSNCIQLIRKGDQRLVCKVIQAKGVRKSYAKQQLSFMMGINHPNVVSYIHHQFEGDYLRIYMPYYPLSDLHYFLTHHDPPFQERIRMLIDVLVGLQQLHSRMAIHRDIKLKNIFLKQDRTCVVGDLGIATISVDTATSQVGTFGYNAPEIYSEDDFYNEKVDVWAVGIIAYQLLNAKRNGKVPFPFLQPQQMLKKINTYGQHIEYDSYFQLTSKMQPCDQELPEQIKLMIERMLKNNPQERIGWLQFYQQNILAQYDEKDRLCAFKAEYRLLEDAKASIKSNYELIKKFKEKYFFKMRHILSMEHCSYFEHKYPLLKKEMEAVYRVYLRQMRTAVEYYNQMRDRRIYKYVSALKPFYKAVVKELYDVEVTVASKWDKKVTNRTPNVESNEYFYAKLKFVTELLDQMDISDFKQMMKL